MSTDAILEHLRVSAGIEILRTSPHICNRAPTGCRSDRSKRPRGV